MKIINQDNLSERGMYLLYANHKLRDQSGRHVFICTVDPDKVTLVSYISIFTGGMLVDRGSADVEFKNLLDLFKFMDTKFDVFQLSNDETLNQLAEMI